MKAESLCAACKGHRTETPNLINLYGCGCPGPRTMSIYMLLARPGAPTISIYIPLSFPEPRPYRSISLLLSVVLQAARFSPLICSCRHLQWPKFMHCRGRHSHQYSCSIEAGAEVATTASRIPRASKGARVGIRFGGLGGSRVPRLGWAPDKMPSNRSHAVPLESKP